MSSEIESLQRSILSHALMRAAFEGWTARMLENAAEDAGYAAAMTSIAFPNGVEECLDFFMLEADRAMLEALQSRPAGSKISEKIPAALLMRLEWLLPHREAVRRAIAFYALPSHAWRGLRVTLRTADTIWHAVGDRSTDFNYYTKRISLSGIMAATTLIWLDDKSAGQAETRAFLIRRIRDLGEFGKFKRECIRWYDQRFGHQAS